jgi:2-haloacid dehalogenase
LASKTAQESSASNASIAVFDMGGVLLDWNPRHLYRKLIPDPGEMERFLATVTTTQWHGLQDQGGNPAEATRRLTVEHPGKEALIEAFYGRFDEMLDHPFPQMADLVEHLQDFFSPRRTAASPKRTRAPFGGGSARSSLRTKSTDRSKPSMFHSCLHDWSTGASVGDSS